MVSESRNRFVTKLRNASRFRIMSGLRFSTAPHYRIGSEITRAIISGEGR